MILFKHSLDLQSYLDKKHKSHNKIGFVPTMGALHPGHISLIANSKKECDVTVCSIYVNPVQFNNPEDFKKYPITLEADILLLEKTNCEILFIPTEQEIYPDKAFMEKHYDLAFLEKVFEGSFRPGHFQGVCMVMDRLLHIVQPTHLYLGQKDYQQTLVIKKLVADMGMNILIRVVPTLREKNGLAMSSRNTRLTVDEKELASSLYKSLKRIQKKLLNGDTIDMVEREKVYLQKLGFHVDYLGITNTRLEEPKKIPGNTERVILIAAYLNNVRLIDNVLIPS
ncbi:MAG: pantoate--beta-alanine ligase [Ginsengibacter sp.]